jgi:predicted nucleic acid-binding protein
MLYLLDSTVLIDFLRGRPVVARVRQLRDQRDVPCTTGINVEEIVRGLWPRELEAAKQLFRGLRLLPIGADEGWRAGCWRREHAARGVTLAQADCLIAAAAASHGARLVTGNPQDFPMTELDLEHWPVGR